ncbi:MAG: SDR family NAD(P)-dependent oxidoreductase, partial [Paracoccaceae bacterium]
MTKNTPNPAAMFDLTGRVACVTGASSGLGRRAAVALASAGAKVVGVARRSEALDDLKAEIGENADAVVADVADRDGLDRLTSAVSAPFGPPDILIHAAGINT